MADVVLIVAAHPDDEALGCGGTIARHTAAGDIVHVLFLSDGVSSRGNKEGLAERNEAAEKALDILGVNSVSYAMFPDNAMDGLPLIDIVKKVEEAVSQLKPRVVYTHHSGDLNVDHQVAAQAVMTACRPQPGCPVEESYGCEVLSSTEWQAPDVEPFKPSYFVDIEATLEQKMEALEAYDLEMRDFPHARSYEAVKALATVRGVQNGMVAAEAFTVLRFLKR